MPSRSSMSMRPPVVVAYGTTSSAASTRFFFAFVPLDGFFFSVSLSGLEASFLLPPDFFSSTAVYYYGSSSPFSSSLFIEGVMDG